MDSPTSIITQTHFFFMWDSTQQLHAVTFFPQSTSFHSQGTSNTTGIRNSCTSYSSASWTAQPCLIQYIVSLTYTIRKYIFYPVFVIKETAIYPPTPTPPIQKNKNKKIHRNKISITGIISGFIVCIFSCSRAEISFFSWEISSRSKSSHSSSRSSCYFSMRRSLKWHQLYSK